jgi:cytochrome c
MAWARVAVLAVIAASTARGHASEALADKHACLNCHQVDKKMVGPAFKSIAEKYKGQSGASDLLRKKIAEGGSGVWGSIPMPAMPQVPAEESRALVAWMLNL